MSGKDAQDIVQAKLKSIRGLASESFDFFPRAQRPAGRLAREKAGVPDEELTQAEAEVLREMGGQPGVVQARLQVLPTGPDRSDIIIELKKNYPATASRNLLDRYFLRKIAWGIFESFFKDNRGIA